MFRWLTSLFQNSSYEPAASPEDWADAEAKLNDWFQPCAMGELASIDHIDTSDRKRSWWGGNFLGAPGESLPTSSDQQEELVPVFQVRTDELPVIPPALEAVALMTVWLHPKLMHDGPAGVVFDIRMYESLDNLVPLGPGIDTLKKTSTIFPIKWHLFEQDLPEWEIFLPSVSQNLDDDGGVDWYYELEHNQQLERLRQTMPIKIGGYPRWWQEPQDNDVQGDFVFLLDSSRRGRRKLPAHGTANIFKTQEGWELRFDCT